MDSRHDAVRGDLATVDFAGSLFVPHYVEPRHCQISGAPAAMLAKPASSAEWVSELLPGEGFALVEIAHGYGWGYSLHDHRIGYVAVDALSFEPTSADHAVIALGSAVYARPQPGAPPLRRLPIGSRLAVGKAIDGYLAVEDGYVPALHVARIGEGEADPVRLAESLAGQPYVRGGRGGAGFDAAGLVQLALGLAGIACPRDRDQQAATLCETLSESAEIARGDLLFFADHVAIALDSDQLLHACPQLMTVIAEPVASVEARHGAVVVRRRARG